MPGMEYLSDDLLRRIICLLPERDSSNLSKTNRRLRRLHSERFAYFQDESLLTASDLCEFLSKLSNPIEKLAVRGCHWLNVVPVLYTVKSRVYENAKSVDVVGSALDSFALAEELFRFFPKILHFAFCANESQHWALSTHATPPRTLRSLSVTLFTLSAANKHFTYLPGSWDLTELETVNVTVNTLLHLDSRQQENYIELFQKNLCTFVNRMDSDRCRNISVRQGSFHFAASNYDDMRGLVMATMYGNPTFGSILPLNQLTVLKLALCNMSDERCLELLQCLESIVELDLSFNSSLTHTTLSALIDRKGQLSLLRKLWIAGNKALFTGEASGQWVPYWQLQLLSESFPLLSLLDISGCFSSLTQRGHICGALTPLTELRDLYVSPDYFLHDLPTNEAEEYPLKSMVEGCKFVSRICIEQAKDQASKRICPIPRCALTCISSWLNLKSLTLINVPHLERLSELKVITKNCKDLKDLVLENVCGEVEAAKELKNALGFCGRLEKFGLAQESFQPSYLVDWDSSDEYSTDYSPPSENLLAFAADGLKHCHNLKYCRLDLPDELFVWFGSFSELNFFFLRNEDSLDEIFKNTPKLLVFHLFCKIGDQSLSKTLCQKYQRHSLRTVIEGSVPLWIMNDITNGNWSGSSSLELWWEDIHNHK
eukprot:m.238211 g.238211  ORF g.238211 m.238211 type:complete len:656 (+) comp40155_c0_seq1:90-2057(+)